MRKFMSQQGHIERTCLNTIEFGWVRRFESEFRVAHCSMNDPLKLNDSKHSHPQTYSPHWPYPSSACYCDASPRSKVVNCESIRFGMAIFKRFASAFTASINLTRPLTHNDVCTTAQDNAKTAFLTHRRRTRNQRNKVLPIHMLDVRATGLFSSILEFLSSQFLSFLEFLSSQFLNSPRLSEPMH